MKKRVLLLFSVVPFILGFLIANIQGRPASHVLSFNTHAMQSTDKIILSANGDIYTLTQNGTNQITHGQNLIEPILVGNTIIGVQKTTNYASLLMFDQQGNKTKTLFDGNSEKIDTMSWITDPAVNSSQDKIAYVSDKDKALTNVPDNALYVFTLSTGKSTNIVKPDPYSGGLAHPIFDPIDNTIMLYDYYQYDPKSLMPYSTIEQYNASSGEITTVTYENKNAYQESFSPDGKKLLFLGRDTGVNTVTLYIADFDSSGGLSNIHTLLTGDLAYPRFSYTNNHIYFLQTKENSGYNLVIATINKNMLSNIQTVVSGNRLLGNSSYSINKNE